MSIKVFFKRLCAPGLDHLKNNKDVAGLECLLADLDYGELRLRAAEALGTIVDTKAAVVLGRFLDDTTVGQAAAKALAAIAEADSGALTAALKAQHVDIPQRLAALLVQADSPLRGAAAMGLAQLATKQSTISLASAFFAGRDSPLRPVLLTAIAEVATANPQLVAEALPERESPEDGALIKAIAECKNERKTAILLSIAPRANKNRRRVLEEALINIKDGHTLQTAYAESKNAEVRQLAANALRGLGGDLAIDVLLDDVSDAARENDATTDLTSIGRSCVPAIVQRIARRKGVKETLYNVLREMDEVAVTSLLDLVSQQTATECNTPLTILRDVFPDSSSSGLRKLMVAMKNRQLDYDKGKCVIEALNVIGWNAETPLEKAWAAAAKEDWAYCAGLGDASIPVLIAAQKATSQSVKDGAKSVLCKMSGSVVRELAGQLHDKDKRLRVVEELNNFPSAEVLALMMDAVKEWSTSDFPVPFRSALKMMHSGIGDPETQKQDAELMALRLLQDGTKYCETISHEPNYISYYWKEGMYQRVFKDLDALRTELADLVKKRRLGVDQRVSKFLSTPVCVMLDTAVDQIKSKGTLTTRR